jgi:ferrous iron transport protein A
LDLPQPITAFSAGTKREVTGFTDDAIASKLMAMGVLPGSKIALVRAAPMGGGWYVEVDNIRIALRKQEAACILTQ